MNPHTILVADDDYHILELLQWILIGEGYHVLVARDGEEAMKLLNRHKPDLLVLDAAMPVMDGFEVLSKAKSNASTAHIPVIMLTARDRYADVAKGQQRGCDFYHTKPFKPDDLTQLVKRALAL